MKTYQAGQLKPRFKCVKLVKTSEKLVSVPTINVLNIPNAKQYRSRTWKELKLYYGIENYTTQLPFFGING